MIFAITKIVLGYFAVWSVGYLVLSLLDGKSVLSRGFKFFSSFFIGIGLFTMEFFTAGILGVSLGLKTFFAIILGDLAVLGAAVFFRSRKSQPHPGSLSAKSDSNNISLPRHGEGARATARAGEVEPRYPSSALRAPSPARGEENNAVALGEGRGEVTSIKAKFIVSVIVLLILIKIAASFWQVTHIPTFEFDAWNNWNLRAKVIFTERAIPLDPADEYYLGGGIKSYPLNDALWKVSLANLAGRWQEAAVNSVSVVYYIILLGLFYFCLPRDFSRFAKIIMTYLLAGLPFLYFHSWIPYADLSFAAYLFLALVSFFKFLQSGSSDKVWLYISAIALALCIWTKNEGFAVAAPILFIASGIAMFFSAEKKLSIKYFVQYWLVVLAVSAPWLIFRFVNHLDVLSGDSSSFKLVYNASFLKEAFDSIFLRSHFNFLWFLFFGLMIFRAKKIWHDLPFRFLAVALVGLFLFYNAIIIFTDKAYDLSALARVNLQIAPIALFFVILVIDKFVLSFGSSPREKNS